MFRVSPHRSQPITWWFDIRDRMDFEPEYQRRSGIWEKRAKAYLIDSILNGYDVPKFYVADFVQAASPLNEKRSMYAIIDGKQRFLAMFDFIEGELRLNDDFEFEEDPSQQLGGKTYEELLRGTPAIAHRFRDFRPDVMSVVSDEKKRINSLFVRLNRGKALTGAEIRNAMEGPIPVMVRELANHELFTSCAKFDTKRGGDRNAALKLLLIESKGQLASLKKSDLDAFVFEASREDLPEEMDQRLVPYQQAMSRVQDTMDRMALGFGPRHSLLGSSGIVPLYYWFFRNHQRTEPEAIVAFLGDLDRDVRKNREQSRAGRRADRVLLTYDERRRSPNDQAALEFLYGLMERRYVAQPTRAPSAVRPRPTRTV